MTAQESPARTERRRLQGLGALVVVQFCFGLFPLFVKLANDPDGGFGPRPIAFWRIVFGASCLGLISWKRFGRRALPARRDLVRFALCALLGITVNQVFAMEGITRTSVLEAGLLFTLIPVFAYGVALLARQETFGPRRALGLAVALGGAALLVLWRTKTEGVAYPDRFFGNVLIVLNCLSYATFLVIARPLLERYPPLVVTTWVFVLSLWALPWIGYGQDLAPDAVTTNAWVGLGYTLVFATVVAYVLNTFALECVSASTTASFVYLQPLISGLAGVLILGERVTPVAIAAALLLLGGMTLIVRSPSRGAIARPRETASLPE